MASKSLKGISRTTTTVLPSKPQKEGAGVTVRRTIGSRHLDHFDPFLLLDEFNTDNPNDYISGFPDHPHRGFETVTYMLDGLMEHRDHKGNHGILRPGAVQWMTAGRGIIHSEMPKQQEGKMHGFQMWVNLPSKQKMIPPRYQDVPAETIPVVKLDNGVSVKVMAGDSNGVQGAVKDITTQPLYLDINVPSSTTFSHPITEGHNAFIYVIEGEGFFGKSETKVGSSALALLDQSGDSVQVVTKEKPVRFLLAAAKPLNEPIVRYGPFVMNTQKEIEQAFSDYQTGKF